VTPETLHRLFEVVADAPGGVQRLRELILQLAVRGKLVPQDPNDEPASALLERIEEEKRRFYEEGKIRKLEKLPPVGPDEVPFEVPEGWVWVRIGDVMDLVNGRAFKPSEWSTNGLRIVRIQNLNDENAPFNYCDFQVDEKYHVRDGDLLISWSGTPGTSFGAFVWRRGPAVLNQHIFRCEIFAGAFDHDFARIAINARLDEMIEQAHGGVGLRHITKGKLEALAIVLPPLGEQHRIVAKVDELMTLCDELEERQRRRAEKRVSLNRSALHHLTTATDDAELARHWRRIRDHFDVLYEVPETVAEMRQAILQLAVRGKLVPQDPNDEPASVLLDRIEEEKRRLYNEGKIRKLEKLPPVGPDEVPFEVPEGWRWMRLGDIGLIEMGNSPPGTSYNTAGEGVPLINGPSEFSPDPLGHTLLSQYTTELTKLCRPGDLLICVRGATTGRTNIAAFEACIGRGVALIRAGELQSYVNWYVVSRRHDILSMGSGSTFPSISYRHLAELPIPIPPLPEQHRIVAKVDRLMALCDELETKLTASRTKAECLAASVVHEMSAV